MTQADANRVQMAYVEETTYGTTPSSQFVEMRLTGESLKKDTGTITSNEIRSDRSIVDIVRNSIGVSGDVNYELAYGTPDPFFYRGLQADSTWSTAGTITQAVATWTVNATNKTITASASESFDTLIQVGDFVRLNSTLNVAVYAVVSAVTSTVVTLNIDSTHLTNETINSGGTLIIFGKITNGTTFKSFSLERKYSDLSNEFSIFTGMAVDSMALTIGVDQIVTGSFGFLGKNEASAAATASNPTSYTAAGTTLPFNAVDHVNRFAIDGLTVGMTGFSMQVQNNLRQRMQVGSLGAVSIGSGFCQVTGTLTMYFESKTQFDKYLNFSEMDFQLVMVRATSQAYAIHLPAVKFTGGQRVAGGVNSDIIAEMTWAAYKDTTYGTTISISKYL